MTIRRLGLAALVAAVVVAVGMVAAPLLARRGHLAELAFRPPVDVPASVVRAASAAAHSSLGCPPRSTARPTARAGWRWCGRLHVTESSVSCATPARCQVELVGTLLTAQAIVPVALTVAIDRIGSRWRALEVRS